MNNNSSIAHQLISPLRRDRDLDDTIRTFLIRSINNKCYPDKERIVIEIWNWNQSQDSIPKLIKIDSQSRHCNVCGRKAYYITYKHTLLFGFRLCGLHLTESDRQLLSEYYAKWR